MKTFKGKIKKANKKQTKKKKNQQLLVLFSKDILAQSY